MSYQVLALKWRPALFADLVGQEHVSRTLTNAILSGRVHHAFVFTGARGVGKTSAARILAKALNCPNRQGAEPCNACDSCLEIAANRHDDVIEIDGASNNGVDNVRELREMARYMPASAPFKVIIIDEVHMLSTPAFNALLKILEEPPEHVKFIFATTEPHKIPVTILSRCQRYDFRKISQTKVTEQLKRIATAESIDVSARSLRLIAQAGGGSMRDSLSTFDQVLAFCPDKVEDHDVLALLGVVDRRLLLEALKAVVQRHPERVFSCISQVDELGHSFRTFCQDLVEMVRSVILVQAIDDVEGQLGISADEQEELQALGGLGAPEDWHRLLSILLKVEVEVAASTYPRLLVEMALVRAATLSPARSIEDLIRKLEHLQGGAAPPSSQQLHNDVSMKPAFSSDRGADDRHRSNAEEGVPEEPRTKDEGSANEGMEGSGAEAEVTKSEQEQPQEEGCPDLSQASEQVWPDLVRYAGKKNPRIGALLDNISLLELSPSLLRIGAVGGSFLMQQLKDKETCDKICELAQLFLGQKIKVEVQTLAAENVPPSLQQSKQQLESDRSRRLREDAVNHPTVRKAVEIFAGEVVSVTPNDKGYV